MRRISFGILVMAILVLSACTQGGKFSFTKPVPVAPDATNGDEYLYSMDISGFDFDHAVVVKDTLEKSGALKPAGCSSVRKGNYHGRNLDFFINDQADIIIRTAASEGTFASIGTCTCNPKITKLAIDNGALSDELWEAVPLSMTDGINENGVCINVNVVPLGECKATSETNKGGEPLSTIHVVRFVLDKAKSVDHAVELLKSRNLVANHEVLPFEYHWMISDKDKTVVVEIWNDEIVVVPSNIMTNFYVSHPDTPHGDGHERWNILEENYDEAVDLAGMQKLMKRVWYSQTYDAATSPRWYSEMADEESGFTYQDVLNGNTSGLDSIFTLASENYGDINKQKSLRSAKNTNWYTTHSIVYDIEKKTMALIAQENDGCVHDFSLKK